MAFNSLAFATFFLGILVLYYIVPKKIQWVFLLLASYLFYGYASVKFLPFIALTTVSTYFGARLIDENHKEEKLILANGKETLTREEKKSIKEREKKKRRFILVSILVINFGILAFLKYYNFFADNINALLSPILSESKVPKLNLILPLGISFYTFQTMSYIIDVYWKKISAEKNIGKVALYVSFFPQMFLGPIGRFADLAPQLVQERKANGENIKLGLQLMAWGFFKKMVIADRVAMVANSVFNNHGEFSGLFVAVGVFMYAMQDYTDFSGGVDIVRGVAQCMGINMAENFKRPYFSRTIPEFWRRWHMSLGAWMKDYVFYPFALTDGVRSLSKSAKNKFGEHIGKSLPIALGNLLVFFLVGVWHGATWNYIVWGLYYGLIIGTGGMLKPVFVNMIDILRINTKSKMFIAWQIFRTFWLTCIGCIIFRANGLGDIWAVCKKFLMFFRLPNNFVSEYWEFGIGIMEIVIIPSVLLILLVVDIMQERGNVRQWLSNRNLVFRCIIYLLGFLIIVGLGVYGPGFDQSQFVYMQF